MEKDKEIESVFDIKKPSLKDKFFGKSVNPNNYIQKFQKLRTMLVFGVIVVVGFYVVNENRSERVAREEADIIQQQEQGKSTISKNFDAVTLKQSPEEIWRAQEAARISSLIEAQDKIIKRLEALDSKPAGNDGSSQVTAEVAKLNEMLDQANKRIAEIESKSVGAANIPLPELSNLPSEQSQVSGAKPPQGAVITNRFVGGAGMPVNAPISASTPEVYAMPNRKPTIAIQTVKKQETEATQQEVKPEDKKDSEAKRIKTVADYVPAGSTVRAVLLSGVDAPAGPQADKLPVIMMLDDLTQLPNRAQFNAKECRLIGAAQGDLSSERAHIRLETLSCVDEFDVVHEMKAKGYVFGEDGKPGVRGRLVSKQGQLLANALLAGVGSGMGQIIGQQSMTYNQTALGTTTTVNPNTVVQGGVGIGVSRAMERLAQYYIKMAEKIFPIIEVDAGRVVDIAFTGGVDYLEDIDTKGGGLVGLINPQASSAQQAQPANIQQQMVQQMMQQQMMMNNPGALSNSNFD